MGSGCDKCNPAPTGAGSLTLSDGVVARLLEAGRDVKTDQNWMHKLEELQVKYAQEKGLCPEKIMELADSIRASCRTAKPMQKYLRLRDEVIRCYSGPPPPPDRGPGSSLACAALVSVLAQAADAGPDLDPEPDPDPDESRRRRCTTRCKLKCGQLFGDNSNP